MNFSKWYLAELEVRVDGRYEGARPAPMCFDHDSPNFSDPGDPEVIDDVRVYLVGPKGQIDLTDYLDMDIYEDIVDAVIEEVRGEL